MNFIPYAKQDISEDDISSVCEVLRSSFLTGGDKVQAFEDALSAYCGAKYCLAVSSGTAALHLCALALLKQNDEVLTTPNSFVATSNAILYARAKPKFIDICEDGNINLDLCEEELKKNKNIKALFGVHFSGNPLNQEKLKYLKEKYNIKILEDCAHSLGASFKGVKAGSCKNSECSIFSFHPVKHITTGEGGAITTNSKKLYEKMKLLRSHGISPAKSETFWTYDMLCLGFNYRLSDISCALGLSQLKKIKTFLEKRRILAKSYNELFLNTCVQPIYKYTPNSSYHLFVVRVDFSKLKINKEELLTLLKAKNIGTQVHYNPINKQKYYKELDLGKDYGKEKTPVMDAYNSQAFSLPMYTKLSQDEQKYIVKTILDILQKNQKNA